MSRRFQIVAAVLVALCFLPALALARCDQVQVRLWIGDQAEFYPHGATLPVPMNQPLRVAVVVDAGGRYPSSTRARVGYAPQLGVQGTKPVQVGEVLELVAQNTGDVDSGTLRFKAVAAGKVTLGYEILGIDSGTLDDLASGCSKGPIHIQTAAQVGEGEVAACQEAVEGRVLDEMSSEGAGVTLYGDPNFRGNKRTFFEDVPRLRQYRLNDAAASIRLGEDCRATLYEKEYFSGRSMDVSMDVPNLKGTEMGNDTASSVKVTCTGKIPEVNFRSRVETDETAPGRAAVSGQASIRSQGSQEFSYRCEIDAATGEVLSAEYSRMN